MSIRKISPSLKGIYSFYFPQSISRLIEVTQEPVKAWRERPQNEGTTRCFWMGPFFLFVEGKRPRNPCTCLSGSSPRQERKSSGFGSSAQNGKVPQIGKRFSRTSSGVGSKGYGSSSPMTFRLGGGAFPKQREPLCPPCRAGCAEQNAGEGPRSAGRGSQENLLGRDKRRPRKLCGACGSCGAWFITRSWSAGRPRLMLFRLSCVIQGPFAATSTPLTNWSG
jgi:hypothetical protein